MQKRVLTLDDVNEAMRAIAGAFDDPEYSNDMLRKVWEALYSADVIEIAGNPPEGNPVSNIIPFPVKDEVFPARAV